jgi:hypothetical protein
MLVILQEEIRTGPVISYKRGCVETHRLVHLSGCAFDPLPLPPISRYSLKLFLYVLQHTDM